MSLEPFQSALISLKANKIRSILTMLGVIIGVMSVVALISLGRGIQNYITDQFNELGSNLLFIAPGKVNFGGDPASSLTKNKLDQNHIKLIETYAGASISQITPYLVVGETATNKTKSYFSEVTGVSSDGFDVLNYKLSAGRNFTKGEERNKAKVAILGPLIVQKLYTQGSPLNQKIELGGDLYEIIGVFEPKGSNYDDQIIVPYTAAQQSFSIKNFSSIIVKTTSQDNIALTIKQIEGALLRDLKSDDFSVNSQADILASIQSILQALTLGLGAIAGISLVVGGIGIMNIMLVSVTERTREIGLRKAVGANRLDIASQFLVEAVTISVLGGLIGLALGWGLSLAARYFLRTEVPFTAVILAFGFSVFVGVIFGTYPAVKAGNKDPITALGFE